MKNQTGKILSVRDKTLMVIRSVMIYDSKYKRYYTKTYKRMIHYQGDSLSIGDTVRYYNCKRISTHKSAICYGEKI